MENKKPNIIGLITARGGSVRLPRKNIKSFCGLPLVAWSIIQSECSRYINKTVLTTDDDEIAEIGIKYGALVIRRPKWDNGVAASFALKHAIESLHNEEMNPDEIVYMLPTSPLKKPGDIDQLILNKIHCNTYKDSIDIIDTFSINKETAIYNNCGYHLGINEIYEVRQEIFDKKSNYSTLCGGWGIGSKKSLMDLWEKSSKSDNDIDKQRENEYGKKQIAFSIEPWQCFETDYEDWFKVCEVLMEQFILKGKGIDIYKEYAKKKRKEINF